MIFTVFDAVIIKMKINANPDDLASVLDASVGANGGKLELESSVKVGQAARLYLNCICVCICIYICVRLPPCTVQPSQHILVRSNDQQPIYWQ